MPVIDVQPYAMEVNHVPRPLKTTNTERIIRIALTTDPRPNCPSPVYAVTFPPNSFNWDFVNYARKKEWYYVPVSQSDKSLGGTGYFNTNLVDLPSLRSSISSKYVGYSITASSEATAHHNTTHTSQPTNGTTTQPTPIVWDNSTLPPTAQAPTIAPTATNIPSVRPTPTAIPSIDTETLTTLLNTFAAQLTDKINTEADTRSIGDTGLNRAFVNMREATNAELRSLQYTTNAQTETIQQFALTTANAMTEHGRTIAALEAQVQELRRNQPTIVTLCARDGTTIASINVGRTHKHFSLLLRKMQALLAEDRNIWLQGPAGTGKDHAIKQAALALSLQYYVQPPALQDFPLLGYKDANGTYHTTPFREWWINGGVLNASEIDKWGIPAANACQGALANGHCTFPNNPLPLVRHVDSYFVANANTFGSGPDGKYIGSMKMDAAFLDRFVYQIWDYDEELERSLATNTKWLQVIHATRALARTAKGDFIISIRALIKGQQLLAANTMTNEEVVDAIFAKYRTNSNWSTISAHVEAFARENN